ncbi:MAG: transcriptional repressor, partial [Firmicutes bacterium]|nr:transcriptional repressor [Bacillota bacterium]
MRIIQSALKCLRAKNIHPSVARIKVLSYLIKTDSHPTVDMIYTSLLPEMPTLSKTTVYKTMDLLIEAKLARLVHT